MRRDGGTPSGSRVNYWISVIKSRAQQPTAAVCGRGGVSWVVVALAAVSQHVPWFKLAAATTTLNVSEDKNPNWLTWMHKPALMISFEAL